MRANVYAQLFGVLTLTTNIVATSLIAHKAW